MTIAPSSVLRRILSDVTSEPKRLAPASEERSAGDHFWWLESGASEWATPLHFWAHGLLAFLRARDEEPYFLAVAGHGLCEAVDEDRVRTVLAEVAPARFAGGGCARAYRMLDQPVFRSYVTESADRFSAFYWAATGWDESEFRAEPDPEPEFEFEPEFELEPDSE